MNIATGQQSDQQLFLSFREYGTKTLLYRQKCIGLLPEIFRRRIHEQQGFTSIFEFAAKFAGLSQEQVKRVLSLDAQFQDKPALKTALESGEVSVNKLARIASVATADNQEELAMQVKLLSKNALETLARDIRAAEPPSPDLTSQNNLAKSEFVPGHKIIGTIDDPSRLIELIAEKSLKLSPEVITRLRELKEKGIDINQIIMETLDGRETKIEQEKKQLSAPIKQSQTRYIPADIRRILHAEFGNRCSIPGCDKPAEIIHHTQRFALAHNHDPRYLAPLCRGHHELAHSIDLKVQQKKLFK